ncbi:MAG: FHA domain-containing protein [Thermomicrobiales bacterium]
MTLPAGADWGYLALRLLFIGAIYWFIAMVVKAAIRELRALAMADVPAAAPVSGRSASLLLLYPGASGIPAGMSWDLTPGMTIGRRAGNTIEMDDPFLSGKHAEIVQEAGEWWLRDLGSTNGTLLNYAPVTALTALRPGDIVQFGHVSLQVLPGTGTGER